VSDSLIESFEGLTVAKKAVEESTGGKKVGGRTIAGWKAALAAERIDLSNPADDVKAVDRLNAYAKDGGYGGWTATAEMLAKWRKGDGKPKTAKARGSAPGSARGEDEDEGEATAMLRQLVRLLGKEAVKRLVDSL
jgi:hypothetical protein